MATRLRQTNLSAERGFVLVAVIWGVGLIALLDMTFLVSAHMSTQLATNLRSAAEADYMAEAAVNIGILHLLNGANDPQSPGPGYKSRNASYVCRLPDDSITAIRIEDEGGKIDINGGSRALLFRLLTGVGLPSIQASLVANNIIMTRGPMMGSNDGQPAPSLDEAIEVQDPGRAVFLTTLELEQVPGISTDLFDKLLPYVTVYSRSAGFDALKASPNLIAVLSNLDAPLPFSDTESEAIVDARSGLARAFYAPSNDRAFSVRAEVLTDSLASSAQEGLIEFGTIRGGVEIREWRKRKANLRDYLSRSLKRTTLPSC